ncbi:MAG: pilus assembly protein [Planctomycetes bacterium]|nr:pilus assembly protein [Planctomycetota bacterium]
MAFVASIFLVLLFGVMEYCRFLFFRQLITTAAREGARYAVVNTTDSTIVADTQAQVKHYMSGFDQTLPGYQCTVYKSDATGANLGSPSNAQFGQYVAVDVQCTYNPILPSFLFMGSTYTIRSRSLMYSEAN